MADIVTTITDFLSSEKNAHLIIPNYQRVYSWGKKQWKILSRDIFKLIRNNTRTHFMGGIISITNTNGCDDYLDIIDGQQRLTSISLFILALIKWTRQSINFDDESVSEDCYQKFNKLVQYIGLPKRNGELSNVVRLSLREALTSTNPVSNDNAEFDRVIEISNSRNEIDIKDNKLSRVLSAFLFFYDEIKQNKSPSIDPESYFKSIVDALRRIKISHIPLKHDVDDPQQVFESMNATGLSLLESDKCRNLMVLSDRTEQKNWIRIWVRIEQKTLISNCSETDIYLQSFLKLYKAKLRKSKPKINTYYDDFKGIVDSLETDEEKTNFYNEVALYADYYYLFKTEYAQRFRAAHSVVSLNITQFWPLILELIDYLDPNNVRNVRRINEREFEMILNTIETYIIRKQICSERIDADTLVVNIVRKLQDNPTACVVDLVDYYILYPCEDKTKPSIPDLDKFVDSLYHFDLYKKIGLCRIILENIEQVLQQSRPDRVVTKDATIEHVMPQSLSDEWKEYINYNNSASLYKQWLNRLGNLTLINPNTELGNKLFYDPKHPGEDKMTLKVTSDDGNETEIGYRASRFCLNEDIKQNNHWGFDEIKNRHDRLINVCCQIWGDIHTNYEPNSNSLLERDMSDENLNELNGYFVFQYKFEDDETSQEELITWPEFSRRCVEYLLDNYTDKLIQTIKTGGYKDLIVYSDSKPTGRWCASSFVDNVYIRKPNTGGPTAMLPPLIRIINDLDLRPEDFVFIIRRNKSQEMTDAQEMTGAQQITDAQQSNVERAARFRFSMCDINIGDHITWCNDDNLLFRVCDDNHVEYNEKRVTLSKLAKELLKVNYDVNGTLYFKYNGELLNDIRKRKGN